MRCSELHCSNCSGVNPAEHPTNELDPKDINAIDYLSAPLLKASHTSHQEMAALSSESHTHLSTVIGEVAEINDHLEHTKALIAKQMMEDLNKSFAVVGNALSLKMNKKVGAYQEILNRLENAECFNRSNQCLNRLLNI